MAIVKDQIKAIISELTSIPIEEIHDNDVLSMLGIDSLLSVELIVKIEECLEIVFDDSKLNPENLTTVQSVISLVENH